MPTKAAPPIDLDTLKDDLGITDATQDALALRNAREAIREEPW